MTAAQDSAPAVVVDGVSKAFRLPQEKVSTLKERALHPFRRTGYNHFDALKDVSFAVPRGEFFGIVGRNGSGKSTLLKCLAGIYRVDQGGVYINGRMSTFIELGVAKDRRIARCSQSPGWGWRSGQIRVLASFRLGTFRRGSEGQSAVVVP